MVLTSGRQNGLNKPAPAVTNSGPKGKRMGALSATSDIAKLDAMATAEHEATLVSLTEAAAAKIKELQAEESEGDTTVLRVAVQGGGCSGFEYALGFDRSAQEGDHEFELHGVQVVVDPFSAPYLQGSVIDFLNGLQESGFKIDNPNVVASCGCGHSFQVDDEAAAEAQGGCGSGCAH
jgi:iron-sulfur cluster assembly protein